MSEISDLNERLKRSIEQREGQVQELVRSELLDWSRSLQLFVKDELNTTWSGIAHALQNYQQQTQILLNQSRQQASRSWLKWLVALVVMVLCSCLISYAIMGALLDYRLSAKAEELSKVGMELAEKEQELNEVKELGISLYNGQGETWLILGSSWKTRGLGYWKNGEAVRLERR